MINNNLQDLKLGAPPSIVLSDGCPNAELSVQVMDNCDELTLIDGASKCTKHGALATGAKLLNQKVNEDLTEQTWYTPSGDEKPINVNIQGSGTTELTTAEINALYEALSQYTDDSYMSGNVHSGGAYEDEVLALMERFPDLHIEAAKWFVAFKDPEVLRVLLANGVGDESGISKDELAAVTDIGSWFKNNQIIESFEELSKTGVTKINDNFANCENLERIGTQKIESVNGYGFCRYPDRLYGNKFAFFPNVISGGYIKSAVTDFGKKFSLVPTRLITTFHFKCIIFRYNGVVNDSTYGGQFVINPYGIGLIPSHKDWKDGKIFVQPSYLEAYKDESSWFNSNTNKGGFDYTHYIFPVGGEEWQSTMQQLASEEGYELKPGQSWSDAYIDYDIYGIPEEDRPFVSFKDAEVEAVLAKNGVGGDGLITNEALAGVTDIGTWFQNNVNITSFDELAKTSVSTIRANAFKNCARLRSVKFSDKIQIINENAFHLSCLGVVEIPSSVKTIGQSAFGSSWAEHENSKLTGVFIHEGSEDLVFNGPSYCIIQFQANHLVFDIPKNIVNLGQFGNDNLRFQKVVIIRNTTPPQTYYNAGNGMYGNICFNKLFVPASAVEAYKSAYASLLIAGTTVNDIYAIGGSEWVAEMRLFAEERGYTLKSGESYSDEYIDWAIYGLIP